MKRKHKILIVFGVVIVLLIVLFAINSKITTPKYSDKTMSVSLLEGKYTTFLNEKLNDNVEIIENFSLNVLPNEFNNPFLTDFEYSKGSNQVADLNKGSAEILVNVAQNGLYEIALDYFSLTEASMPITISVEVDGTSQYYESEQITLDTRWKFSNEEIGTDRYGNDVAIEQERIPVWQRTKLRDSTRFESTPLKFYLSAGEHILSIGLISGEAYLGEVSLEGEEELLSYQEYISNKNSGNKNLCQKYEAENITYKNSSSIQMETTNDVTVTPFSLSHKKLNMIGSGSFNESGNSVTYEVNVEEAGLYYLTLKVNQGARNTSLYRTVYINGSIPFEEAKHIPFPYTGGWKNITLSSNDGTELLFYLEAGQNLITFEVDNTLLKVIYEKLQKIVNEMNQLGLDIKKLTGNNTDKGIDWEILSYFPNIKSDLQGWIDELNEIVTYSKSIYGYEKDSYVISDYKSCIKKVKKLLSKPDEIPRRLTLLSEGTSCSAQILANAMSSITSSSMAMDCFYIHGEEAKVPTSKVNFFKRTWIGVKRFFVSFVTNEYDQKASKDELIVWMNKSKQYVDLLQKLVDSNYTSRTNKKVQISILTDEGKLLLTNSAGTNPDVAIGVSAWIPVEYGMRGAIYNMREYDKINDIIKVFYPAELVPETYNDMLFGIPETENFFVLFYRKDILGSLNLSVPTTWDEVTNMLPTLKRNGMNFYIPLSSSSSFKAFNITAPFIYQFGGDIYAKDGFSAAIDSENSIKALKYMTDLYTEYNLPYQVSNFFNDFKLGQTPIGVADFGTYLSLLNAAAEISGLWDIAPMPGVYIDGEINNSAPGAATSCMVFENSKKKEEAMEFLAWYMSTETQLLFSETLVNTLGDKYLWNTANIEAFKKLSWNETHKQVILTQWEDLKEVPKIPGSYIVEREISNIWNAVVFNDAILRSEVGDSVIKMNREITRKMEEFKFLNSKGERIREFILPNEASIRKWGAWDE